MGSNRIFTRESRARDYKKMIENEIGGSCVEEYEVEE